MARLDSVPPSTSTGRYKLQDGRKSLPLIVWGWRSLVLFSVAHWLQKWAQIQRHDDHIKLANKRYMS
uniref:Uncharacterized protein n=1 Tax=Oryza nivara TaxID=4536 RepID=A0A0E0FLE6_ORYNI